ncbi:unnamed protein product [Toxocara canis]|uniref:Uncharacterized protein n=1 Tax=Toxocara canis TaxID=6265 RepID=A0A183V5K8_TOXCA|nr:unnamed protein product [Toxocara canis]
MVTVALVCEKFWSFGTGLVEGYLKPNDIEFMLDAVSAVHRRSSFAALHKTVCLRTLVASTTGGAGVCASTARDLTSDSQQSSSNSGTHTEVASSSELSLKKASAAVTSSSSPNPADVELFRDDAAPIFATPRGPGKKVYKTVEGKDGEQLADYVLFEDSMNKAKVTWNDYSTLTSEERDIYMAHLKALRERRLWYKDPKTGFHVMCSSQLLLSGKCCGNGCRHCPYGHENAKPEVRKRKKWNGAFYV